MRAPPRPPSPDDDIATAITSITHAIRTIHDGQTRLWRLIHAQPERAYCPCGCLLLYAGEHCPHCETPMPRKKTA